MKISRTNLGLCASLIALAFALALVTIHHRKALTQERGSQRQGNREAAAQLRPRELRLRRFEFDVVTVNANGTMIAKRKGQARHYVEDLGGGVTLEMVEIPGGAFRMGTSYAEAEQVTAEYMRHLNDDTRHYGEIWVPQQIPQHPVTVPLFFMGKYEVTQAQWRAVAQLPRVSRDLTSEPSFFKGDNLPVETVPWDDAVEFCERLSRVTGREYRLPSEAEWEYACRAGTTTQFHFGDTVTTELMNYNGHPYGSGPEGIFREKTVPVGSFEVANAFGLYDMHGSVQEWCMDPWHENYNGAPRDGRVWVFTGDTNYRVVRNGSWGHMAAYSRAAFRKGYWATNKSYTTGFRVVAVAKAQ